MLTPPLKTFLRRWVPQGVRDLLNRATGHAIYYSGHYANWSAALTAADGYAENHLIERLHAAALAVHQGKAAWEQDGVTRDVVPPDYPLLASFAQVVLATSGRLRVLDFGGGLGSTYRQCRRHLHGTREWSWHIVEQPAIARLGARDFATAELHFHDSLQDSLAAEAPDVALFSATLQYIESPAAILEQIVAARLPYLVIDRHPVTLTSPRLTVQTVPRSLYSASYPCWLFAADWLEQQLGDRYQRVFEWPGKDPPIRGFGFGSSFVGSFWKRREP